MKRILVDIRHLVHPNPSGVGEYTIQILRALFRIDNTHEYTLLSSGNTLPNFGALGLDTTRFDHVHIRVPNKLLNARMSMLSKPTLDTFVDAPINLIFLPNLNIAPLPEQTPSVLMVHDLSWKLFPEFYSKKMLAWHKATKPAQLFNSITHALTPSSCTARDLRAFAPQLKNSISVIPHGIDAQYSHRMQARDHGVRSRLKLPKNFILFVGTLEPRKNILAILDGLQCYRKKSREDLHLVLAGKWGWKSRAVKKRLFKRDTKHWVHELGYVKKTDLPALYRSAKAFVWPSIYEGFGLPVLEAMKCGTPVITTHTSSLPELTGRSAIHVDPYNSQDVTTALEQLLSSQSLTDKLQKDGVERAAIFSWEKAARSTLNVFENTMNP